jgi:Phage integrase family
MCWFLDAGKKAPQAQLTGVQKAPRHEVAGSWEPTVQRVLWGFNAGADLDDRRGAGRIQFGLRVCRHGNSGECNRHLGERPKRTDARADGCYIGWKESAAGVERAHWTGKAATLTGDLAHDVSILIIVGRQLVQQCPLAPTVGEAIRHYLQEVRLQRPSRHVFLTLRASYGPLSRSALWKVVSDRLRPLKLSVRHQGPHSLRHACATRLLAQGLPLTEIGDHWAIRTPSQPASMQLSVSSDLHSAGASVAPSAFVRRRSPNSHVCNRSR